jgi:hypothetical protein
MNKKRPGVLKVLHFGIIFEWLEKHERNDKACCKMLINTWQQLSQLLVW